MKTTINERFKMLRTSLTLTQNEFANMIGLTPTQLSRIENGSSQPQNSTLKDLFKKVEVSHDWLLNGKGELNAKIIDVIAQDVNPWKDALVSQVKEENNRLQKEVERLWQMIGHYTGGAKPNFLKATEKASTKLISMVVSGASLRKTA